ncbi:50S ribosomal protein L11 [Candidatus Roizmanbacteria bacterium RIFCSPLOWO2_12_FULL_40_12]|uniref:Large ribosomal subunit protein uL11 n=1 Tax=Candidatus Roizmanbacteria bacterium RIFCSPLOWO2_01_FULL_40_42 TaxID=1802066 RepID=A0A1F7J6E6_9BACT|nr:MAG: 50S ribosomal protein L11 [Candidatus Roizmanbacteria bacterium RIFCSPHIGHO2_01_FULL_40_98]OGK29124.1 MAG: 50S ribosomal protein L11 [Candidatus Roizmanbacteria bacterium RIFCSPHIGHO2_02_FULL_40_53]OGK29663.1 MAG: 50S ribosomal protein L11 [Candidatus Roizmanbacteria bacterium RIFCSPHIGHO2_12_41_18]OGK37399.1 MAG: 50S ribosomal protein L11 [Candidatus Roizmanbacteria bacterium RIFCSPHIGHO2_12_FULL_40_130]OGK51169.1 MAG: 50S ribosomal protein L11 [Candidatus Roizmanbacteria bacterium RIF
MAKKIKAVLKVNLPAGEATPAPPVGPVLGQHGVPIMDFIKEYNAKTAKLKGKVIPAVITVYEDRTFTFITKLPPVAEMIKQAVGVQKGSGTPNTEKVGKLTASQVEEIAKEKMGDLNAHDIAAAANIVKGTARSMGVETE